MVWCHHLSMSNKVFSGGFSRLTVPVLKSVGLLNMYVCAASHIPPGSQAWVAPSV